MELKYITVSGANEHTDIQGLSDLLYLYPKAELGIQVSKAKSFSGSARYKWIKQLHDYAFGKNQNLNLSLHINPGWVENVCNGFIPQELMDFLQMRNPDGSFAVKRMQLNFKIGRETAPDMEKLHWLITTFNQQKIILSYNEENKNFIDLFYFRYGAKFDLLYDASHGEGISPQTWYPPMYSDVMQGYSGGLSPENINTEISKIALLNIADSLVWVDAESKLKDDAGHLSLEKTAAFLQTLSKW